MNGSEATLALTSSFCTGHRRSGSVAENTGPSRVGISFLVDIPPTAFGFHGLSHAHLTANAATHSTSNGHNGTGPLPSPSENHGVIGGVLPDLPPREWLEVDILGKNPDGSAGPAMVWALHH